MGYDSRTFSRKKKFECYYVNFIHKTDIIFNG